MRSTITLLAGALALACPAGALAHGNQDAGHGAGDKNAAVSHAVPGAHGRGGAHRHIPMVALLAHGTLVSVDAATSTVVVQVTRANHHGSRLVGTQLTLDLSNAAISVADANGDGQENLADLAAGDKVLVHSRIPLHGTLTGALHAARLIDQTHPTASNGSPASSTS